METPTEAVVPFKIKGALRQVGNHALIGLLDSELFRFGTKPSRILRGEIFDRWQDMTDAGGTTLALADWKDVYRNTAAPSGAV